MGKKYSLILGLLAGTALGILFAPKTGKTLRKQIKEERDSGGYGISAIKEGFVGMGKEVVDTAKEAYESEDVQEQIAMAREKAEEMAEEGKEHVRRVAKKVGRKAKTEAGKVTKKAGRKAKKVGRKAKAFTKKKIGK
jgi:gas vesicle protein